MIIKNIFKTIVNALFVLFLVVSMGVAGTQVVRAYGYDTYDGGSYNTYDYSDYGYNTYDYSDYGYNTYDYSDYGYNTYDYSDYGYNTYDYSDYGYNTYDYSDYGYNTYDYSDYGYNTYDYSDYGYNTYDYSDYGYNTYDYSDYGYNTYAYDDYTNYGGYTDYYTPSSSNCYGSYCGGNSGYTDYYTPSQTQCSGSSCGGSQSRPSSGGLGLNLSYQDNDTTVTNNTCSNVGGKKNGGNCNTTIDNSTTTITTTTNTNCSNNSGDGNCNTTNNTVVARNDDEDEDFDVICRVSDSSIDEGDTVTFSVDIDGGERPYDIEWDGDISGDGASERVRFNRSGTYEAEVTVEDDNGRRARDTCTVRVGDEDEDDDDDDDDDRNVNVVTRTNLGTPTGNLASLDSVFLSSVPYTGPKDILNALGVLAFIAIWSTAVAMYFKKRRQVRATAGRLEAFKAINKSTATIR